MFLDRHRQLFKLQKTTVTRGRFNSRISLKYQAALTPKEHRKIPKKGCAYSSLMFYAARFRHTAKHPCSHLLLRLGLLFRDLSSLFLRSRAALEHLWEMGVTGKGKYWEKNLGVFVWICLEI
jgi:hypothetical protein